MKIYPVMAQGLERWRGRPVVVAVSGGSDSVALLRLLYDQAARFCMSLTVAHVHHGVRAEAAEADAAFVADLAAALDLPFELGRWTPSRSGHFEADARQARYRWLAQVAAARGTPAAVAVGHTHDDQAETILHRILRGTGPRGLAGMPRARPLADGVTLIRPLLGHTRADLQTYLASLNQPWRDDATNANLSQTRARIRHNLLPSLARDYNPNVADALVRLARLTRAERAILERWADRRAAKVWSLDAQGVLSADLAALRSMPSALRADVARAAWRDAGWPEQAMDERAWTRLSALVDDGRGASRAMPGGFLARIHRGRLTISPPIPSPAVPESTWLPIPGSARWGQVHLTITEQQPTSTNPVERINADALDAFSPEVSGVPGPALRVRGPEPGDRLAPLGLDGHTRRLVEFLAEQGVPADRRAAVPLVCDRQGIIWLPGHRIAHRIRLTEATKSVLALVYHERATR